MSKRPEIDEPTGTQTTGHEWDGIKELDTPMPKWWLWTFYACILWSVVYWVVMPAWPILVGKDGYTKGVLGYSQREVVAEEMAEVKARLAEPLAAIAKGDLTDIVNDPQLMDVALATGRSAFGDNCAPCHGSGAAGGFSFPNLNDDDWLWGGTLSDIQQTITHGIRWDQDPETRFSAMPRFLADGILSQQQVADVTEYVLKISGQAHEDAAAGRGAVVFGEQCAICHGENGQGDKAQGAPNLTDKIWLYGGDRQTVYATVSYARNGVMPAWGKRLSPAEIKSLTLFVFSRGGGVPEEQAGGAAN